MAQKIIIFIFVILVVSCDEKHNHDLYQKTEGFTSNYALFNENELNEWKDEQIRIEIGSYHAIFSFKKIQSKYTYLSYYKGLIENVDNESEFTGNFKFYNFATGDKYWNEVVKKLNEIGFFEKSINGKEKPKNSVFLGGLPYVIVSAYTNGKRNQVIRFEKLDNDYEDLKKLICLFPSPDTSETSDYNFLCPDNRRIN